VQFSETWPAQTDDYDVVAKRWTRRGILRAPLAEQATQIMEVYATILSPEWRAAYVHQQGVLQKMSPSRLDEFRSVQEEQAKKALEVEMLVSTSRPEHNDLHRAKSIWTVSLVGENGEETQAVRVDRDNRPKDVVAAEFSHYGDFTKAYRASFPYSPTIWHEKKLTLRISSTLGAVDVAWTSR